MANEITKRNEVFLIYQDENGIVRVNVRFQGDDVWLPVEQIMELFGASQQDVSYHIKKTYAECELDPERTHKKIMLVRQECGQSHGSRGGLYPEERVRRRLLQRPYSENT